MKGKSSIILSGFLLAGLLATSQDASAINFAGQEDRYIALCKSSTLSGNDQTTCREFNGYLKEKTKGLHATVSNTQSTIKNTKNSIDSISQQLATLKQNISAKEAEIDYLETSIRNLKDNIDKKEEQIKNRLYSMQSYINKNSYVDFIFGASNFSEMIARIKNINELTSNDKNLITSFLEDKKDLEQQKSTVALAKEAMKKQQDEQSALQGQYLTLYEKQNKDLISQQVETMQNSDASAKIDSNLAALAAASKASQVKGITSAIPSNNGAAKKPSSPSPSTPNTPNATPTPGDSQLGIQIANIALSKQGSPYVWGTSGPNTFDCSGLVAWSHNQAGVRIGRTTAAGYAGAGRAISYQQLSPGDVITFRTNKKIPEKISHIGIYIGGGKMVHAPTFNIPVSVVSITDRYWQNAYYNARRLY